MIVKVHRDEQGRAVVAVCDTSLLGKKVEEGNRQLDLTSDFYNGAEKSREEAGDIIRNAYIINLVGQESVKLGLEEGVIEEEHVMMIDGVPHAQGVLTG